MAKIRVQVPDSQPHNPTGNNAPISLEDLKETAAVFLKHQEAGASGIQGLVDKYGYTRRTAARRVQLARKAGLLPETKFSLNAQARVAERGTAYAPKGTKATKPPTKFAGRRLTREQKRAASQARIAKILEEELRQTNTGVTENNEAAKAVVKATTKSGNSKALKPVGPRTIEEIRWEDPPAPVKRNGGLPKDKRTWFERLDPIKAARKEHPQEWAIIRTYPQSGKAASRAAVSNLKSHLLNIPAGRWEFTAGTTNDGLHNVYARYLGPDYRRKVKK